MSTTEFARKGRIVCKLQCELEATLAPTNKAVLRIIFKVTLYDWEPHFRIFLASKTCLCSSEIKFRHKKTTRYFTLKGCCFPLSIQEQMYEKISVSNAVHGLRSSKTINLRPNTDNSPFHIKQLLARSVVNYNTEYIYLYCYN